MPSRFKRGIVTAAVCAVAGTIGIGGSTAAEAVDPPAANTAEKAPVKAKNVVDRDYQVQKTGYWCSAAAARIALSTHNVSVSQQTLASHMGVTPNMGLPDVKNLPGALNHYSNTKHYEVKKSSNDGLLKKKLTKDVIHNAKFGHAVVINVVKIGSAKFGGGHYATIVGYKNHGNQFLIADPADGARESVWLSADDVVSGIKLNRYVA